MLRISFDSPIPNAQHLDPTLLPPGNFTGEEPPEEVQKFRSRVINALRQRQLEFYKNVEQPINSLLPDPKNTEKHTPRRKNSTKTQRRNDRKQAKLMR